MGIPCLAGLLPIKSHRMLRYLEENVPGIVIPDAVRERILAAPAERVREESIDICADIVRRLRGRTAGVHIMPVGDYTMVAEILARA